MFLRVHSLIPYRLCLLFFFTCALSVMSGSGLDPYNSSTSKKGAASEAGQESLKAVTDQNISTGSVQVQVMDFSDQYTAAINEVMDGFISTEPDPGKRVAAYYWKVRYGSAAMAIAASRDPRQSLLDMVVFISAGK